MAPSPAPASTSVSGGFEDAIRPVTNPTLFDSALPQTMIRPIFITQNLSDFHRTSLGNVPVGGDAQVYALQFEYALNERFSLVASKDGYIDYKPNGTLLRDAGGFANIAAGFKYAFILDPEQGQALSTIVTVEVPTGNRDVWQGSGKGAINLGLAHLKLIDGFQFQNGVNLHVPFSETDSLVASASTHISYEIAPGFHPFIEASVFQVLEDGNGTNNFKGQGGDLVPSVAQFEGGDLINLGSADSRGSTIVTGAAGLRYKFNAHNSIGAAYEIPLTKEENNLMQDRVTVDYVLTF